MVRCTYEDCFRQFKTHEAMIKHKIKEPEHEYCARCNLDCADIMEMLAHQVASPKHIVCPICGQEFKSEGGRTVHYEQSHRKKQNLPCPGCGLNFPQAAALMSHIENDECEVIPLAHFSRQRAEKQIIKDAWEATLDPNEGFAIPKEKDSGSHADSNPGGVSLLDDDRPNDHVNWRISGMKTAGPAPLQPITDQQYTAPKVPIQGLADLSLDKFPTLQTHSNDLRAQTKKENFAIGDDLFGLDEPPEETRRKAQAPTGVWGNKMPANSPLKSVAVPLPSKSNCDEAFGKESTVSHNSNGKQSTSMFDQLCQNSPTPPLHHGQQRDQHVRTAPASIYASHVDPHQYYNHITSKFVCPGAKCGHSFVSPEAFIGHLNAGAHVGGKTTCPSCLRRFDNTASLIAHCESGSKKCNIRKSANYNQVMRELTGGLIGTAGHHEDGSIQYTTSRDQGFW